MSNYTCYYIAFLDPNEPYPINLTFADVNQAKEIAHNHSKEHNSCCLVVEEPATTATARWQYNLFHIQ